MTKLYEIPGRERELEQLTRYASLGREITAFKNEVRVIDGQSKNTLSTLMVCKNFGTCGAVEMANYFANLLQAIVDDATRPAANEITAKVVDVSPDRDILAEMTLGFDQANGVDTTVEGFRMEDGRIVVTNITERAKP